MGTSRHGVNGGFSGKAGNVTGSSWKSIDYMKGLAKKTTKPATQAQLAQRAKFATAVQFLRPIKDLLNRTFSQSQGGSASGFNLAIKRVFRAIEGVYPDYSINFAAVSFSEGLLSVAMGSVLAAADGKIILHWDSQVNSCNAFADDIITVLMYDPTTNIYSKSKDSGTRSMGESIITMRPEMLGKTLQVYYFFTSRDEKNYSPSFYVGEVVVI